MVISNCKGIVYINMISDDNLVKNVFVNMILLDIQYKMFRNMSWLRLRRILYKITVVLYCILCCIALHCIVLCCIALHCIALYCIVLYYNALYCIVLYCILLDWIALYCITLRCIVLCCIVLYCIVLYCIVLHCIVLHCIALYCIVLYCIALHCIALYCIVLYCIVLYCIVTGKTFLLLPLPALLILSRDSQPRSQCFSLGFWLGTRLPWLRLYHKGRIGEWECFQSSN